MPERFADRFADLTPSLQERYNADGRAYHNWSHVQALLGHYEHHSTAMHDPGAVEIALYYHDVIYVPGSTRNERDSAEVMVEEISHCGSPAETSGAETIILATAAHAVPEGIAPELAADCALFLDMDLAILGSPPAVFDAFDAAIRQEFSMFPDEFFFPRRKAAMANFLERERIYLTDRFHDIFDGQARTNLTALIQRLSDAG